MPLNGTNVKRVAVLMFALCLTACASPSADVSSLTIGAAAAPKPEPAPERSVVATDGESARARNNPPLDPQNPTMFEVSIDPKRLSAKALVECCRGHRDLKEIPIAYGLLATTQPEDKEEKQYIRGGCLVGPEKVCVVCRTCGAFYNVMENAWQTTVTSEKDLPLTLPDTIMLFPHDPKILGDVKIEYTQWIRRGKLVAASIKYETPIPPDTLKDLIGDFLGQRSGVEKENAGKIAAADVDFKWTHADAGYELQKFRWPEKSTTSVKLLVRTPATTSRERSGVDAFMKRMMESTQRD